jgi:acyl-CoA synthetase (AMP-forming)/AMP-acid ligase II
MRNLILERGRFDTARPFLEDAQSDRTLTYGELTTRVHAWGISLNKAGIPIGSSVLLDIADPLLFGCAYLGVIASGRCTVPLDPTTPDGEAARALAALAPAVIVSDHGIRANAGAIPHLPADIDATLATAAPMHPDSGAAQYPPGRVRLRTSGSTGDPKIVELSERQLLHVAASVATHNRLTKADRGYNPLPLFHVNAEVVGLLATLVAGSTLVLDRGFHRSDFWPLIDARAITWINAVPAILAILAQEQLPQPPKALRLVRSASAALPDAVRRRLTDALGSILIESYGMTEAASQITATELDETPPAGSAGRAVGIDLQVRDAQGRCAPVGEIGRIWICGAGVIDGYVGGRSAERFDAAGWLDTGDLGHLDGNGYLYLAGRADDVINRGGEMVYPREIEEVLMSDGRVLDAIAVGRPDDILGHVPVAYVIAREAATSQAQQDALIADLEHLCSAQLSRFKRPALLMLVDELPRAPTGKVRRHEVRLAAARS